MKVENVRNTKKSTRKICFVQNGHPYFSEKWPKGPGVRVRELSQVYIWFLIHLCAFSLVFTFHIRPLLMSRFSPLPKLKYFFFYLISYSSMCSFARYFSIFIPLWYLNFPSCVPPSSKIKAGKRKNTKTDVAVFIAFTVIIIFIHYLKYFDITIHLPFFLPIFPHHHHRKVRCIIDWRLMSFMSCGLNVVTIFHATPLCTQL